MSQPPPAEVVVTVWDDEVAPPPPAPFPLAPLERWSPLLFLAVTFATFGRALGNAWAFDSTILIPRLVRQGAVLGDLVDPDRYGLVSGVMSWRPLTVASFHLLDNGLFQGSTALSHALNLVIHALNGWLLFRLMRRWQWNVEEAAALWPALLGALLFTVHPLTSEAVLCAGFRFDLLATTFVMAGLLVAAAEPHGALAGLPAAVLAAGAMFVGLLAKESAVLVAALAPLAALVLRRDARAALLQAGACVAAAGLFGWLWLQFRYVNYNTEFLGGGGRLLGVGNFLVSAEEVYLRLLAMPWPLRVNHAFVPVDSLSGARMAEALAAAAALVIVAVIAGRFQPFCWLGAAWVIVGFLPVSQIVPVPDPVAERFCYLPMAGVGIFAAGLLRMMPTRFARVLPAFALVLLPLAALSFARTGQWKDDVTLNLANWEAGPPEDETTRLNLGAVLLMAADGERKRGNAEAEAAFSHRAGVALSALAMANPRHAEGRRLMAVWHLREGRRAEAVSHFRASRELWPENPALVPLARFLGS